jgi:hypothetical protein
MPVANRLKRAFMPQGKPPSVLWCLAALVMQAALLFALSQICVGDISELDGSENMHIRVYGLTQGWFLSGHPRVKAGLLYAFSNLFVHWFVFAAAKTDRSREILVSLVAVEAVIGVLALAVPTGQFLGAPYSNKAFFEVYITPTAVMAAVFLASRLQGKTRLVPDLAGDPGTAAHGRHAAAGGPPQHAQFPRNWRTAGRPAAAIARCLPMLLLQLSMFAAYFKLIRHEIIGMPDQHFNFLILASSLFYANVFFRWLFMAAAGRDIGPCILISLMACEAVFGTLHLAGIGEGAYLPVFAELFRLYAVPIVFMLVGMLAQRPIDSDAEEPAKNEVPNVPGMKPPAKPPGHASAPYAGPNGRPLDEGRPGTLPAISRPRPALPAAIWCFAALAMQAALFFVLFDISRSDPMPILAFATDVYGLLLTGLYIFFIDLFIRWLVMMIFKIDIILDIFIGSLLVASCSALFAVSETDGSGFISFKFFVELYAVPAIMFSLIVLTLHFSNKLHINNCSAAEDGQAAGGSASEWRKASWPRRPFIEKRAISPVWCLFVFIAQIASLVPAFSMHKMGFVGEIIELHFELLIAGISLFFINAVFRWLARALTGNDASACIFISLLSCEAAFGVLHLAGFGGVPYADAWPVLLGIYGVASVLMLISLLTRRVGRRPPAQAGSQ